MGCLEKGSRCYPCSCAEVVRAFVEDVVMVVGGFVEDVVRVVGGFDGGEEEEEEEEEGGGIEVVRPKCNGGMK